MYAHTLDVLDTAIKAWATAIQEGLEPPYDEIGKLGLMGDRHAHEADAVLACGCAATLNAVIETEGAFLSLLLAVLHDASQARTSVRVLDQMVAVRAALTNLTPGASGPSRRLQ